MTEKIATVGLGYVGLPVALAFARRYPESVGFDINAERVAELTRGKDRTLEVTSAELAESTLTFSHEVSEIADATTYVVAVPTPIDADRRPDLRILRAATELVAKVLKQGDLVIYESTVYPGATREVCVPILEAISGLEMGQFDVGYSPERINPGDKVHRLETIIKVVSGSSPAALERVAALYESIVDVGVHRASSIEVAEAAKVIENTQRDLNIALMNELALIFDRLDIPTADVLTAAGTKWNFLNFTPGLVGGHCIGVDPYYLTAKAEAVGYDPQVILAGRRINDGMGAFVAQKAIKMLVRSGVSTRESRVGVLGLAFKEDVPDLRNSRVPDILRELGEFGVVPLVHDPLVDAAEAHEEYGVTMSRAEEFKDLDALIVAVPHAVFLDSLQGWVDRVKDGGLVIDVKSVVPENDRVVRWRL